MATRRKPLAVVTIKYYGNGTEVNINGFSKLTPAKIQRSFDYAIREWSRQQQGELLEHRKEQRRNAAQGRQVETAE